MTTKTTPVPKPDPERKMTVAEFMDELSTRKPRAKSQNKPGRPRSGKVRVTLLLKPETIAKFKATGPGWQARISDILDAATL